MEERYWIRCNDQIWDDLSLEFAKGMWVVFSSELFDSYETNLPLDIQKKLGDYEGGSDWQYLISYIEQHDLHSLIADNDIVDEKKWKLWIDSYLDAQEMSASAARNWTFVIENSRGGQIVGVDSLDFVVGIWNALRIYDGSDDMYQLHFMNRPILLNLIPSRAAKILLAVQFFLISDVSTVVLDYVFGDAALRPEISLCTKWVSAFEVNSLFVCHSTKNISGVEG
jgi:hypothetical protein